MVSSTVGRLGQANHRWIRVDRMCPGSDLARSLFQVALRNDWKWRSECPGAIEDLGHAADRWSSGDWRGEASLVPPYFAVRSLRAVYGCHGFGVFDKAVSSMHLENARNLIEAKKTSEVKWPQNQIHHDLVEDSKIMAPSICAESSPREMRCG